MLYDVIVIGAGPAGIAASSYCERKGLETLLLYDHFGGQINYSHKLYSIPCNPEISSEELLKIYRKSIRNVNSLSMNVTSVQKMDNNFVVKNNEISYSSKTVIACTGAKPQILNVLKDSKNRIYTYRDYPYCDFGKKDKVVIIGGGYCGLDISSILSKRVNQIYLVEKTKTLGGNIYRQKNALKHDNIKIYVNSGLGGVDDEKVWIISNNGKKELHYTKIVCSVGDIPNSSLFSHVINKDNNAIIIKKNSDKYSENMTHIDGLFAAGDVIDVPIKGFISIAEGMGIMTAMSVYNYLKKREN